MTTNGYDNYPDSVTLVVANSASLVLTVVLVKVLEVEVGTNWCGVVEIELEVLGLMVMNLLSKLSHSCDRSCSTRLEPWMNSHIF